MGARKRARKGAAKRAGSGNSDMAGCLRRFRSMAAARGFASGGRPQTRVVAAIASPVWPPVRPPRGGGNCRGLRPNRFTREAAQSETRAPLTERASLCGCQPPTMGTRLHMSPPERGRGGAQKRGGHASWADPPAPVAGETRQAPCPTAGLQHPPCPPVTAGAQPQPPTHTQGGRLHHYARERPPLVPGTSCWVRGRGSSAGASFKRAPRGRTTAVLEDVPVSTAAALPHVDMRPPFLRVRATATTRAGRPPSNRVNRAPSYHFVQPPPTTQARWTCPVAPRRRACHRHASPLRNASTPRRPTPRASGRRPPCATAWRPASPSNSPRADDRPIAVVRKTSRVRSSPRGPATTAGGLSRCTSSVQQTRAQRVT